MSPSNTAVILLQQKLCKHYSHVHVDLGAQHPGVDELVSIFSLDAGCAGNHVRVPGARDLCRHRVRHRHVPHVTSEVRVHNATGHGRSKLHLR